MMANSFLVRDNKVNKELLVMLVLLDQEGTLDRKEVVVTLVHQDLM